MTWDSVCPVTFWPLRLWLALGDIIYSKVYISIQCKHIMKMINNTAQVRLIAKAHFRPFLLSMKKYLWYYACVRVCAYQLCLKGMYAYYNDEEYKPYINRQRLQGRNGRLWINIIKDTLTYSYNALSPYLHCQKEYPWVLIVHCYKRSKAFIIWAG